MIRLTRLTKMHATREEICVKNYSLEQCCTIAAEARGHMQACLQACGRAVK